MGAGGAPRLRTGREQRMNQTTTPMATPAVETPDAPDIGRLAATEVFSQLDNQVLEALVAHGRTRRLAAGEVIFRHGDPDNNLLYIIYDGRVTLSWPTGEVATRDAVTLLGLSSYFDDEPYSLTATALRPTTIIEVPFDEVRELEHSYPALADTLSHVIAERIRAGTHSRTSVSGVLALPVSSVMNTPLTYCTAICTLADAFRLMQERGIGSLGVLDDADGIIGLATVNSLARAVLVDGHDRHESLVEAAEPVITIAPEAKLWEAEELQVRHGVKYLVVMDGTRPVGMLSQTNILNAVLAQQTVLRERIGRADSFEELRLIAGEVGAVAREAWENNREASRAAYLLSEYHFQLQHRCVALVLRELEAEGHGTPPRDYALVLMGSLARRESLIRTDQDNAILIADSREPDGPPEFLDEAEDQWFERFTDTLNHRLDEIGYQWCPGDIMARNPEYRRQLGTWRKQISYMARHPSRKAARWCNIFFDFQILYGDDSLVTQLWDHTMAELESHPKLLRFMAEDDAEGTPAVGLFNRLITSQRDEGKGRVDIKRNGLRIICNAARIYALSAGIREANTVSRLQALRRQGEMTPEMVESVIAAHEELMDLLLTHQLEQERGGQPLDKYIDPNALDDLARQSLATSMRAIKRFQDRVQGRFGL